MSMIRATFLALAFLIPATATIARAEDKPAEGEKAEKKAKKSKKEKKETTEEKKVEETK